MAGGILGFGLIEFAEAEVARILFLVFLLLFVVTVFRHAPRAGKATEEPSDIEPLESG
jgi:uncharacterized membrane protein YtjA (UPF0391 family)